MYGSVYIQTAVRDIYRTNDDFISFDINKDATIYVVYSDEASVKPGWMNGFDDTGYDFQFYKTSSVYSKNFKAGNVELGGNGDSAKDMYTIIVSDAL